MNHEIVFKNSSSAVYFKNKGSRQSRKKTVINITLWVLIIIILFFYFDTSPKCLKNLFFNIEI